jgi:hypothetical protein
MFTKLMTLFSATLIAVSPAAYAEEPEQVDTVLRVKNAPQVEVSIPGEVSEPVLDIDHFFENRVEGCTQGVCFAMIPFPAAFSQFRKGTVQVLGVTTGDKKLLLVRFYFQ